MPPLLPVALFLLLFAFPGGTREISRNDPFRAIALTVTKLDLPPVCCLKASTPMEPLDDEVLLSFEEWKKKQIAQQEEPLGDTYGNNQSMAAPGDASDASNNNVVALPDSNISTGYGSDSLQPSDVAPHFRVPITDRFNYANIDCSARVHTSHRSAKSPSSVLSWKKDKYMLSPCNLGREKQFVVVELCDDIRIDTVQLANFEFFSGIFKDFTVSVTKTYSTDPDGWTFAGTYRAKNVRGVQSFHLPASLRDFYRFIRIDFLSHYGNEYYCPVSLLRVYGLTHLEEWKWDIWQAESRAKLEKGAVQVVSILPSPEDVSTRPPDRKSSDSATTTTLALVPQDSDSPSLTTAASASPSTTIPSVVTTQTSTQANHESPVTHSTTESLPTLDGSSQSSISTQDSTQSQTSLQSSTSLHISSSSSTLMHASVPEYTLKVREPLTIPLSDIHQQSQVESSNHSTIDIPSSAIISSIPSAHTSPIVQAHSSPPVPVPPTGESIYRTIMNRLTAVENNQTLYMKYVEQQNGAIRDVIRRLGEDVGRLEGITRAQALALQKAVNEWEKQRYQLQMEYKDILRRMELLSHEIILEKRLGVAQLCLLLAVLIFLSLTRGSRVNEQFDIGQPSSRKVKTGLKEWGRRHLSWTGDRSGLAGKSTDRKGWNVDHHGRNGSRDRMAERFDSRTHAKRPKPLVLGHSNTENILRVYSDASDNSKLPFPSSESSLPHRTVANTMNRPPTGTNPHSRSRVGSGTPTSMYSAPIPGSGQGVSRRMAFQRPVTPTSRSHFVFRTPQGSQRSHSFGRSIESGGGLGRGPLPLPLSPTLSWGFVSKSAKNWARTAHLHDVKSLKKKQEQELATSPTSKSKRASMGDTDVDDVDVDVFLRSLKRPSSTAAPSLNDTSEVVQNQPSLLLELIPNLEQHHRSMDTPLVLPVEDENDSWVDTDSVEDGNAEMRSVEAVFNL